MASSPARQVDPAQLIKRLSQKVADLTVQNAMYEIALEDLEAENEQLKQAHIDDPSA